MKIEIKNRWNGTVIHCGEFEHVRACLIDALNSGANLSEANLYEANLREADLRGARINGVQMAALIDSIGVKTAAL